MACCFGGELRISRDTNIPKVTAQPEVISPFLKILGRDGHRINKVTSSGKIVRKTVLADSSFSTLKYVPGTDKKKALLRTKDIWEIRVGHANTKRMQKADLDEDDYAFSIITQDDQGWDFVCESERELTLWVQSLAFIVRSNRAVLDENPQKARLLELWLEADENNDKKLDFKELSGIVDSMNITMDAATLKKQFNAVDVDQNGTLDYAEFCEFYARISSRNELLPLFNKFAQSRPKIGLSVPEFQQFLKEAQGETVSDEMALGIVNLYSSKESDDNVLTFPDFSNFLLNPRRNPAMHPAHQAVFQDMTQPLNNYYIATSHNTYLSGDQLTSKSKTEMYKRALLAGCRCVELDCWDGDDGDPMVYHGYTRTTKIRFRDCIQTINENAFETSPYPVLLSMEVHTSEAQGATMAEIMKSVFGTKLYTLNDMKRDEFTRWSPEKMQKKILVKWKTLDGEDDEKDDVADEIAEKKKKEDKHASNCAALSKTVGVAALKSKDWGETAEKYHMQSFSESKVDDFLKNEADSFVKMNQRMLTKCYPGGQRMNSSNHSPFPAWETGVQAVSLNYQTWDPNMRQYDAKFRQNGRCGYVLKPEYLRDSAVAAPTDTYKLRVAVLAGANLPKPDGEKRGGEVIDPYVVLKLHGSAKDNEANKNCSTKVIDDNGFNPIWNESFEFTITNLDLAMLTLRVVDKDVDADDDVAEANIPVASLNLGYRAVFLESVFDGRPLDHSTVLCHFSLTKL